jgi:hypothetical protein
MVFKSAQVIYGRRSKRVTLARAIVGKIMYFPNEVTSKELLVLFDNLLWLQRKASQDLEFANKFGLYLKVLAYILKHHRGPDPLSKASTRTLSNSFLRNLSGFSFEKRNVLHVLSRLMARIEIRPTRPLGREKKTLPQARRLGVGYRDKGTAKKPWLDGSPSWQEVASQPIGSLKK